MAQQVVVEKHIRKRGFFGWIFISLFGLSTPSRRFALCPTLGRPGQQLATPSSRLSSSPYGLPAQSSLACSHS